MQCEVPRHLHTIPLVAMRMHPCTAHLARRNNNYVTVRRVARKKVGTSNVSEILSAQTRKDGNSVIWVLLPPHPLPLSPGHLHLKKCNIPIDKNED